MPADVKLNIMMGLAFTGLISIHKLCALFSYYALVCMHKREHTVVVGCVIMTFRLSIQYVCACNREHCLAMHITC